MSRKGKVGPLVAAMKKEVETLTLKMQFFHLDPSKADYLKIVGNNKLCSEQSNIIDVWKNACLAEYGDLWGLFENDTRKAENMLKYSNDIQNLIKRFEKRPTSTLLDQIWYMFFATGNYNFLHIGFEAAGHPNATIALRKDALSMFETIKEQYAEKITMALQHDVNYFKNHEYKNTQNAPTVWEALDLEIQGAMTKLNETEPGEDLDAEINDILNKDKQYKFVSDADAKKTPEELEHEKKLDRGAELFNKILEDINKAEKAKAK